MEPIAERAWGRQHHSSHLSTVGRDGRLAPNVGSPGGGVPKAVGWRGLGMAVGRRSPGARHALGGHRARLGSRNPTDRGKAGTKRSLHCGQGEGCPLSIVVAGANLHDGAVGLGPIRSPQNVPCPWLRLPPAIPSPRHPTLRTPPPGLPTFGARRPSLPTVERCDESCVWTKGMTSSFRQSVPLGLPLRSTAR